MLLLVRDGVSCMWLGQAVNEDLDDQLHGRHGFGLGRRRTKNDSKVVSLDRHFGGSCKGERYTIKVIDIANLQHGFIDRQWTFRWTSLNQI
jgi:hypothetical protein